MKVAVVHHFKEQLTIEDLPVPKLGARDALVKIHARGSHTVLLGRGTVRLDESKRAGLILL